MLPFLVNFNVDIGTEGERESDAQCNSNLSVAVECRL